MEPNLDCWHNFTFTKPIITYCIWGNKDTELLFEFVVNTQNTWNTCTIVWPCIHAYTDYNGSTPSLSTVVVQNNSTFSKQKMGHKR